MGVEERRKSECEGVRRGKRARRKGGRGREGGRERGRGEGERA